MSLGDQYSGYRHPFFFAVHYFGGVGGTWQMFEDSDVDSNFRRQPKDSEHLTHMGIHLKVTPTQIHDVEAYRTGHVRVFG
jgi:hypothetical protein